MARRSTQGAKTVLIVDDKPDFQVLVQRIFKGMYYVERASTVEDALAILQNTHIDIILLDIKLPNRLGWDLLQVLGHQRSAPPVIVITSLAFPKVRRQAERLGAIETFFKPIRPSELRGFVHNLLG